ncbi:4-amino-4-deoxychorismate lyase [Bacillus sp. SA1-12]|uniref:aminodeoxychorismate lyase n=1 Tax=Bacillus sp. SA1-12 TaxID=1455638 RepID=UPI0006254C55|nr:aminodeoxychorismate lyase [Bacillus sp. SA1-12]KKI91574.1 4-amino-4-deoxychorismate lyase [Bacillus sp. SA1-12]
MYIYSQSQFIKDTEATISPFDHGFLYGLGAFETFRVYKGFPFLLHDHLKRLQHALNDLGISYKVDADEVFEILQKLLQLNHLENEDVTVRLNISAGIGEVGKLLQPYDQPTVLCFLRKAPPIESIEKHASILKLRRNTPEGTERRKSHHYLNNILGKRELRNSPDVEGIFLTERGYVAEGIVSNIFWVKDQVVYTPSIDTGILNGITRQFVIKCLENLGVKIVEGYYLKKDMLDANEVFITNSSQEVVPIKMVDGHLFLGKGGTVVQKLTELYRSYRTKLLSIDEI